MARLKDTKRRLCLPGWASTRGGDSRTGKLTEDAAKEILALKGKGIMQTEIAKQHGVTSETVSAIWGKRKWKHLRHKCEQCGSEDDVRLFCSVPIRLCAACAEKKDWDN